MKTFRVALIGTGGIAHVHVEALRAQGGRVEIFGAVDLDQARAEAFAAQHGIGFATTDVAEMLAVCRPHLVHVCSPPGVHAAQIVRCLEAGAHVLCEKPLCASLAELDGIEAAETRSGRFCAVVFQWRFGSGGRRLRELVRAGTLGRPLVAVCLTTWFRDPAYYAVPWRGKWETEVGGTTTAHGIHAMDFLLSLLGDWQEVRATMATLDRDIRVDDTMMGTVRFANGALATVGSSVLCPRQETRVRLDFQRATAEVVQLYDYQDADWTFTPAPGCEEAAEREGWARLPGPDVPAKHTPLVAAVLDRLACGERPEVSGGESRRTLEFLSALYQSAATDRTVRAGEIRPGDPFYQHVAGTFATGETSLSR